MKRWFYTIAKSIAIASAANWVGEMLGVMATCVKGDFRLGFITGVLASALVTCGLILTLVENNQS